MPNLWSDVHMDENINLVRLWLGRAGNIPRALETSTLSWYHRPSNRPQTIQNFLCSFPFRKLHITQSDAVGIDFTAIPVESLLLLEDLALLKPAPNSPPNLRVTSFSPHQFPNLVSLQIDTKTMPRFHASRPFATWKKLRVLRLNCNLTKAEYFEILRDASSVEDCSLCLFLYDGGPTSENAVVANLKTLSLCISHTFQLYFMDHFTFPNLHTLVLTSEDIDDFQPADRSSMLHIAPRIGSLRSLNIHDFCMNVDVGFILECLPLLQVLGLHCDKITKHTAEKIGRGELGGYLRELCDSSWSSRNLYEFLRACELRRDVTQGQSQNSLVIARLEKVSVRWHRSNNVDCKQRIQKLREDGIDFEVVWQRPTIYD